MKKKAEFSVFCKNIGQNDPFIGTTFPTHNTGLFSPSTTSIRMLKVHFRIKPKNDYATNPENCRLT